MLIGSATATTVSPIAVEELARRADVVVEARAVRSWSQWDEGQHLIYTYTRFAVGRALKGAAGPAIVVRQMGGTAGGYTQKVAGVRQWTPGEESVLFLRASDARDGSMAVVGLMQGSFVVVHEASGETTVSNGVPEVSSFERGAVRTYTGSRMTLRELERRVGRAVQP